MIVCEKAFGLFSKYQAYFVTANYSAQAASINWAPPYVFGAASMGRSAGCWSHMGPLPLLLTGAITS